jgi:hypothetical protein
VVSEIICDKLQGLDLQYPTVSEEHQQQLLQAKKLLEGEDMTNFDPKMSDRIS